MGFGMPRVRAPAPSLGLRLAAAGACLLLGGCHGRVADLGPRAVRAPVALGAPFPDPRAGGTA